MERVIHRTFSHYLFQDMLTNKIVIEVTIKKKKTTQWKRCQSDDQPKIETINNYNACSTMCFYS
jgi:hypothetical protein